MYNAKRCIYCTVEFGQPKNTDSKATTTETHYQPNVDVEMKLHFSEEKPSFLENTDNKVSARLQLIKYKTTMKCRHFWFKIKKKTSKRHSYWNVARLVPWPVYSVHIGLFHDA